MQNPFDPGYYCSEELRGFGFAHVGDNVRVARNCVIIGAGNIEIGEGTRIDSRTEIFATNGRLRLEGANHIGGNSHLCVAADLTFDEFSGCSQGARVYTATDDYSGRWMAGPCVPEELRGGTVKPIRLGRHCIIGSGSVVLPGCDFADGAAVGALSLVTKPLEEWSLYHGNPARLVKRRSRRVLDLEASIRQKIAA
jgi:acetyltransferase-like isoleucine patch superfamily enzyme